MKWREHKGKLAIGVATILIVVVVLWSSFSSPAPIRLTFLYATNHPQNGIIGVFQLVNELDEMVSSSGGHFRPANRYGVDAQKGDWGANLFGMKHFTPRTTNVFEVWSPTNGGPYRLVLYCLPTSKNTPQYYRSARVRIAGFLSLWVQPSSATQAHWYWGFIFVESQSFEIAPNPMPPH